MEQSFHAIMSRAFSLWLSFGELQKAVIIVFVTLCFTFLPRSIRKKIRREARRRARRRAYQYDEFSPARFFTDKTDGRWKLPGVYILRNKSRSIYYVGQSKNVSARVTSHFSGRGNGDVYADYRDGDRFGIRIIPLKGSGCRTLNELERKYIDAFGAFRNGYNKTRGNRG